MPFPTRPRRMRAILLLAILVPALSACSNAADSGGGSGGNQVFPFTTPQPA